MTLVRDIAPEVFRQRLLVEGRFGCELDADAVSAFLVGLAGALGLRTYGDPVVHSPDRLIAEGKGQAENAGYDAFVSLVNSGIAAYFWTGPKFFSIVIYTCAAFDEARAVAFTREALAAEGEMVHAGF
jgi:S-adenosylmethionine decarboxylase